MRVMKRLGALALGGLGALAATQAQAESNGWYLGLGIGWSALQTSRGDLGPPSGPATAKISWGDSVAANGTAGYKFQDFPIRLEGELRYSNYSAHNLDFGPTIPLNGSADVWSVFANALYDIPVADNFAITLGAGIGAADFGPSINDGFGGRIYGSNTEFTWQAIAGVTTHLSDQFDMQLDYRYQGIADTNHIYFTGVPPSSPLNLSTKTIHSVMLSFRWYLQQEEPPPPPAPYIPPPPASPAAGTSAGQDLRRVLRFRPLRHHARSELGDRRSGEHRPLGRLGSRARHRPHRHGGLGELQPGAFRTARIRGQGRDGLARPARERDRHRRQRLQ
jgi:opacity protein-like surface antigen